MSIFGKLFKKDTQPQKQQPQEQQDEDIMTTPLGEFCYDPDMNVDPPEIGYSGEIEWYSKEYFAEKFGRKLYQPVNVYFDCNTPDTREADICYERFARLVSFKERTEEKLKNAIADYFTGEDGTLTLQSGNIVTKEQIIDKLEVWFISVYRNGDTVFSLKHHFTLSSENRKNHVRATLKADGSVEVNPELCPY